MPYEPRYYREWVGTAAEAGLHTFSVAIRETDLQIRATRDLTSQARDLAAKARKEVEDYIRACPEFLGSLVPLPIPITAKGVPLDMLRAGREFEVGPMAAVAGAIAEAVGRGLLPHSPQVIVENGGDIFLQLDRPARIALFSGPNSPFTQKLMLEVGASGVPLGVCTSSATVGPSLSFGNADAVVTVADNAAMADAAATYIGNQVKSPGDVEPVLNAEQQRGRLRGLLIVIGRTLGAWGEVKLSVA
jgi:uncharacterized protein